MGGAEIAAMNQAALDRQQELTELGQGLLGLYGQNNAAIDDTTGLYGQNNAGTAEDLIFPSEVGVSSVAGTHEEAVQAAIRMMEERAATAETEAATKQLAFDDFISTLPAPENLTIYDVQPILESGYSTVEIAEALNIPESVLGDLFTEWSGSELAVFPAAGTTTTEGTGLTSLITPDTTPTDTPTTTTTETETATPTDLETFAQSFTFSGDTVTADEAQTLMDSKFTVAQLADQFNVTEESLQSVFDYYGGDQYTFDTFISPFKGRELGQKDAVALAASGYTPEQIANELKVDIDDLNDFLAFADTTTTDTTPTDTPTTTTTETETATPTDLETFAQSFTFSGDTVTADEAQTLINSGFTVAELADALKVTEESLQDSLNYHTSGQYGLNTFVAGLPDQLNVDAGKAILNSNYTAAQLAPLLGVTEADLADFLTQVQTQIENEETTELASGGYLNYAQGGMAQGQGYYLGGPTDGMADDVPATIDGREPARLSDGEFVIPADVVSHLGNGNSDAGAKELYGMMDRVRKDRTGNPKQGKEIDPNKYLA
jgi:hypothetical protein